MELHNYQRRIVDFIEGHPNCILSVDMGLGKTAAVLHFIEERKPATVLIVAPKRVAETVWKQEAEKWGLSCADKFAIVKGTPKKRQEAIEDEAKPYKVIGRDNLADLIKWRRMKYDVLVLDELTSFKSVESNRTKAVLRITAKRKIGLTGTFLANGAIDVFGQASSVGLNCGTLNFWAWRAMYFRDVLQGSGLQWSKWQLRVTLEELLKPIKSNIFTLTAKDYLTIPQVTEVRHGVELTTECRKAYEDLQSFLHFSLGGEVITMQEQQAFCKLQQLSNGFVYVKNEKGDTVCVRGKGSSKVADVVEFVERCKGENERVLMFYAFREEAMWLYEEMTKKGLRVMSVSNKDFLRAWNEGEIDVLMAHPASAGHGLNLQYGGRIIVWSSLTYNYELWAQANARLARQGQTKPVQVHVFTADDTCEEKQRGVLYKKDKEQKEFLTMTKQ